MVEKVTSPLPDPLKDTEEEERAKLAALRTERDGDGVWTLKNGQIRTDNDSANSTGYSNYLFGQSGQTDKPLWSDSTHGRIAIRLISRGIFGAFAFTWGQRVARNQLQNYEPEAWTFDKTKPLQAVAKLIDSTAGKAIQFGAKQLASKDIKNNPAALNEWVQDSTRFRHKAYYHHAPGEQVGRSLGAEMVGVTFDFAMASVADATVRNVIQAFDPNNKKPWIVDEKGHSAYEGRFDLVKWGQAVGRASWRIFTKNQGEDWAAALPYVYQMKFQRQWIANSFPGFKISADNHFNGASLKVNNQGEVVGDYQAAGAIDLQARFVGYNWYTLMYRETYDAISSSFNQWKKDGFKLEAPKIDNPVTAVVQATGSAVRYGMKSFIKANLYMQAAVPFFWTFRVPQSKWRAAPVNIDAVDGANAMVVTVTEAQKTQTLASENGISPAEALTKMKVKAGGDTLFQYQVSKDRFSVGSGEVPVINDKPLPHSQLANLPDAYEGTGRSNFSKALNFLGKYSYKGGTAMNKVVDRWAPQGFKDFLGEAPYKQGPANDADRNTFVRSAVDASASYTPYMIAKAEFGLRVDERPANGQLGDMDKAIYRLLDNTFTFNIGGVVKAVGDIAYLGTHTNANPQSREGGNHNHTATAPASPEKAPKNTVTVASIKREHGMPHDPVHLNRANDNEASHNDNENPRWAKSVADEKHTARFQNASTAIH